MVKFRGLDGDVVEKVYSQHISNATQHDSMLVCQAIVDIVNEIQDIRGKKFDGVLIRCDNCTQQFKSRYFFAGLWTVGLKLGIKEWLCAYGLSQHGKDEVDKGFLGDFLINNCQI